MKPLSESILEILVRESDKFVRKQNTSLEVLNALQAATLNFLGSVVMANAKICKDKSIQLDYVESVKDEVLSVFEQIKTAIKSVDLH
jgi:hypothetical protein